MEIRNRHYDPMDSKEWVQHISGNRYSKEELCWLYCCGLLYRELLIDPENLPVVTQAFLDSGMDPNQLVTDELPVEDPEQNYYHTPLIAATSMGDDIAGVESLNILFKNGGNPIRYVFLTNLVKMFSIFTLKKNL